MNGNGKGKEYWIFATLYFSDGISSVLEYKGEGRVFDMIQLFI